MKTSALVLFAALLAAGPALASLPSTNPADPRPVPVIDMHTHVFNARDLPLGGILIAKLAPKDVADQIDLFFTSEANRQVVEANEEKSLKREAGVPKIQSLSPDDKATLGRGLQLTEEQEKAFLGYLGLQKWTDTKTKAAAESVPDALAVVAAVLDQAGFLPEHSGVAAASAGERGMLDFAWLMLHSHAAIYRTLRTEYPAADLFVHHMMDMEKAYKQRPWRDFPDQLKAMRDLDRDARGRLLHFTAFDPFRRQQAQALLESGLKELAVGAKVYPPSGYRARGNTAFPPRIGGALNHLQWDSRYAGWSPADLDQTLLDFFVWSAKQHEAAGLPLFTHCTPVGFEAVPGYGRMSDPEFWEAVLKLVPNLRLTFGHAGGEAFWFSAQDYPDSDTSPAARDWRFGRKVVELCLRYPNVYCEAGYLDQVLQPGPAARLRTRLAAQLDRDAESGQWKFGDKLMYGTDWHMIYKEDHAPVYLAAFDAIISGIDAGKWRRKFFAGNAATFLRLGELAKDPRFTTEQRKHWGMIHADAK
jgi:predicted TIM-barrel fold metal-dependent hydrolase